MKRFIFFNLCFFLMFSSSSYSYNSLYGAVSTHINLPKSVNITDDMGTTAWIRVGEINIPKYSDEGVSVACNNGTTPLCAWAGKTLAPGKWLGSKPYFDFPSPVVNVVGDNGETYKVQFSIGFNKGAEYLLRFKNDRLSYYEWEVITLSGVPVTAHEGVSGLTTPSWHWNEYFQACTGPFNCDMSTMIYFRNTVQNPTLYVKIPRNISATKLTFNNVLVMSMRNEAHEGGTMTSSGQSNLIISGVINLPQRCYISLSDTFLDFGDINKNDSNGLLKTKTITLNSQCKHAPESSKLYLNVSPKDNVLSGNGKFLYFSDGKDNTGTPVIGLALGINKNPDCNGNSDSFRTEYLIRSSDVNRNHSDKINIGLCKYGIPNTYGEMNATINITAKWVSG
ncbi:hypothetical protein [Escherichia coli]|uniref:hypothetical protein n=1 Tax=Escherichia coli TaxID=562 RepID=UPI000BE5E0C3|nr:hypothetical protein [Escherichia coli]